MDLTTPPPLDRRRTETPPGPPGAIGMIKGMTSPKEKITISVDPDVLALVRAAVDEGAARSVSAYFEASAAAQALADRAWKDEVDAMLEETGGPPTAAELAWVESILGPRPS